jgi:hypothetical protein
MWGYSSGWEKRIWLLIEEEHEGGGVGYRRYIQ